MLLSVARGGRAEDSCCRSTVALDAQLAVLASGSGSVVSAGLEVFLALLIGHATADYPLQSSFMARCKDRHRRSAEDLLEPSLGGVVIWPHCLTVHALIHAGAVWLVTGLPVLAVAELVLHWVLDFAKCEGWTNFHLDQALHVACKAGYVAAVALGWVAWPAPV